MNLSFLATLIVLGGLIALSGALLLSSWRYGARSAVDVAPPDGAAADFGPLLTSRRLRYVRWAAALLVFSALGFHAYWGLFAAGPLGEKESFVLLKNRRDQRNRREAESHLRGWVYDRQHKVERALAKYRYLNGKVIRDYPLGASAAHLIGYSGLLRGDAMIERAVAAGAAKKSKEEGGRWERVFTWGKGRDDVIGRDLVLTVDFDLQREVAEQLAGKSGAIVVLNPQTGELLALASAPAFEPDDINNDEKWQQISTDLKRRPLVNRALNEYYLPGSTLKIITASAALESRLADKVFYCRSEGWTPPGSNRPIRDDSGEAHGQIGLAEAITHSCNQYFAQLGVEIAHTRLGEAAGRFGLRVFEDPADSLRAGAQRNLWNTENQLLSDLFAPLQSTFVAGRRTTKYDLAIESIGQGYVQLTPLQMAMVAAAAANLQGNVMRPKIEIEPEPAVWSQAMTAETAARLRAMMASVVERGTAASAFSGLRGKLSAGGKTGTAQREVPVIDPKTGSPVTYRDARGVERVRRTFRIDSWFIGFAPADRPQVAIAVVVEGGGYGGRTAAPIAAKVIARAQSLGLIR